MASSQALVAVCDTQPKNPFRGLQGKPVRQRGNAAIDSMLGKYRVWLDSLFQIHEMAIYHDFATVLILEKKIEEMRRLATGIVGPMAVQQSTIDGLLSAVPEFESHGHFQYSGLFLNVLLRRAGPGRYRLSNVEHMAFVGSELNGFVLEAESFGELAAYKQSSVHCTAKPVTVLPQKGIILVGQGFGDILAFKAEEAVFSGGEYATCAGHSTAKLIIYGGRFGNWAGANAHNTVIHDGTFAEGAGCSTLKKLVIHSGTFGEGAGSFSNRVYIGGGTFGPKICENTSSVIVRGGDFAEKPISRTYWTGGRWQEEHEVQVKGKVEEYTRGEETRWKVIQG